MTTYPFSEPHREFCFGRSALVGGGQKAPSKTPFATPWEFLERAVWTKDEASGTIRQFPTALEHEGELRFDYLRYMTEIRENYRIFAIDKPRRMLISWWLLSLYLYDTLTQCNHANFVGSRKLETSAYMLGDERIFGVYDRIPEDVWPNKPVLLATGKHENGYTLLKCESTGSYIQAIASGADQLRQFTATNVLCDEFAFWERAQESWGAMKPTIDGGGHIDLVSTPCLGAYMYTLLYGRSRPVEEKDRAQATNQ